MNFLIVIVLYLSLMCLLCTAIFSHALTFPNLPDSNESDWSESNRSSRAVLQILLNAQSRLDSLKSIQESLAEKVAEQEESLLAQLQITSHLYSFYGITLNDLTWQKCSEKYLMQKRILILEIASLRELCDKSIRSVRSMGSKEEGFILPTSVLKMCGDEALQLYMTAEELVESKYYKSYSCSVEATTKTLEGLAQSDYFSLVDKKNELLSQELDYLLAKYELYIPDMKNIAKDKYFMMIDQFMDFSNELDLIKAERNDLELQTEIARFNLSIANIPKIQPGVFEEEINRISHYVISEIFERFLRITEPEEKMTMTPPPIRRLPRVIQSHNHLVEMILEVTDMLPISILKENDTQSTIYSGKSMTLGKHCENSPNHLVGTCSYENNEMCVILQDWNTMNGPSPIIQSELLVISKLMLLTKHCTCGFHVECVPIAFTYQLVTEHSTCFLIPNDNGQCRGGVGYPCGSLPLAENEFDRTCVSEKCNRKKNECL